MIISTDFDGVLLDHPDIPSSGKKWWKNKPIKGAAEAIWLLVREGHEVYVCTAREEEDWGVIDAWLDAHGFPFMEITNKKKRYTDVYVDDRAIRFTSWQDIYKYFT